MTALVLIGVTYMHTRTVQQKQLDERLLAIEVEQEDVRVERKRIEEEKELNEKRAIELEEKERLLKEQKDSFVEEKAINPSPSNNDSSNILFFTEETQVMTNENSIDFVFNNSGKIISDEGEYLGTISSKYDSNSIFNAYGTYGSKYGSDSIWNKYGSYGGKYSSYSPFNKYTSSPPKIYVSGDYWGTLSTNKYSSTNVIDPNDLLIYAYQKYDDDRWLELVLK